MRRAYFDYGATTPLDPRVADVIQNVWAHPGNPSSRVNAAGRRAAACLEEAAEDLAALLGASSREIVWTSGATEANNLAIASSGATRASQVLAPCTEHASVLEAIARLGGEVALLPVNRCGLLAPETVLQRVTSDTRMLSVMLVNNEIGVIQPISELCREVKRRFPHVLVHCDASQATATIPADVAELGVDLLSVSAHKMYGPQGIGALWVREGIALAPQLVGGGQQRGQRAGTVPVALAAGFAAAARICMRQREDDARRIAALRDTLFADIRANAGGIHLNGSETQRAPGTLNLFIEGVFSEDLLEELPDLDFSIGSACHGDALEPSHVLAALGRPERLHASIRVCLGRPTTREEVVFAGRRICEAISELRALTRECA